MFKKISSKVDPDATVASEIRKEFENYFDQAANSRNSFFSSYPKQIFIGMVALIVISGIVCFLILTPSQRQKEKMPDFFKGTTNVGNEVTDGVGQIIDLGTKISDLNTLRKQVEAVLAKPKLSHADTVFLEKAIQQLEQSNKPRNQQKP
jgi:preprotein translocase subunit YajC